MMKYTDMELVESFRNGKENEVISYIVKNNYYLFKQTASSYKGIDSATIESTIYEQVWRCLVNYEPEKSKGKLTTMICKYIRNAVRNIAQSNNYQKRSVNNLVNCSSLDAFESGEDKVQETGELAEYDEVELKHMIDNEDLTPNERKYCLAALNNLDGLTMSRIAEQIGVSRAGAKRIRENLQSKLNYILG